MYDETEPARAIDLFILAKGPEIGWFGPALYETGDLNEFLLEGSSSGGGVSSAAARDRCRSDSLFISYADRQRVLSLTDNAETIRRRGTFRFDWQEEYEAFSSTSSHGCAL